MKRILAQSLILFAAIGMMAFSCDSAKDLATIKTDQGFTTTYTLKSDQANGQGTITKKLDRTELEKYGNKLKDFTVNKVTYQVTNNNNNADITGTGSVIFESTSSRGGSLGIGLGENPFAATTETDLGLDQNTLDAIASMILELDGDVNVTGNLTYTNGPVDATFTVKVYGTITANPLN